MKEYRIETEIIPPLLAWYDEAKRILPWRGTKRSLQHLGV